MKQNGLLAHPREQDGVVYAATKADTKKIDAKAEDETITCPLTGEQIRPCCCPLNKKNAKE